MIPARFAAALSRAAPFVLLALGLAALAASAAELARGPGWFDWSYLVGGMFFAGAGAAFVLFALGLGRATWRARLAGFALPALVAGALVCAVAVLLSLPGLLVAAGIVGFEGALAVATLLAAVFDPGWRALLPRWMVVWLPSWPVSAPRGA